MLDVSDISSNILLRPSTRRLIRRHFLVGGQSERMLRATQAMMSLVLQTCLSGVHVTGQPPSPNSQLPFKIGPQRSSARSMLSLAPTYLTETLSYEARLTKTSEPHSCLLLPIYTSRGCTSESSKAARLPLCRKRTANNVPRLTSSQGNHLYFVPLQPHSFGMRSLGRYREVWMVFCNCHPSIQPGTCYVTVMHNSNHEEF